MGKDRKKYSLRTGWVEENHGQCSFLEISNSIERSLLSMNLALDPRLNAAFGGLFSTTTWSFGKTLSILSQKLCYFLYLYEVLYFSRRWLLRSNFDILPLHFFVYVQKRLFLIFWMKGIHCMTSRSWYIIYVLFL